MELGEEADYSTGSEGGIASLVTAVLMVIAAGFGPLIPRWFFPGVLFVFYISIAVIAIGGNLALWGLASESPPERP